MSTRAKPGRPRKQSDTRRAQVREAQRAYRSRQQSQLSTLKARVEQLEDAFDRIGQTIHAFDVQVIQNGLQWPQPRLFHAVQLLRNEVVSQFKEANVPFQDTAPISSLELFRVNESRQRIFALDTTATLHPPTQTTFWNCFLNSSSAMIPPSNNRMQSDTLDDSLPISLSTPLADIPTIPYANTPFTQRLFRAVAESGHRFLSNLVYRDEELWPEFGLSLQTLPRSHIRAYFERVVNLQICNPIPNTRFPFISLGGAGTHFQSPAHGAQPNRLDLFRESNGVSHVHSDEEWFDVHDIEGYLFNEGIELSGYKSPSLSIPPFEESRLALTGSTPGTMRVIDQNKLLSILSRLPVGLGCVAGFRRADVERVVSQNAKWVNTFTSLTG